MTLQQVKAWVESEYNYGITVHDRSTHLCVTNGSAGHYVDIWPSDSGLVLEGERYGDKIDETCKKDRESLLDTLSHIF